MPQIVTGFDRYAQEARALREEKRRSAMDAAAETRAVAQESRQQTQFELAKQDRETALANDAEDRKFLKQERFFTSLKRDIAVLGTFDRPVPIELLDGVRALMPTEKAAGAKYATFSRNAEGLVTGVDYYAEENDPAPMYQVGLDAEGLAEGAAERWSEPRESKVLRDKDGNLVQTFVQVNAETGDTRVIKADLGKDTPAPTAEKEQTPQQQASAAVAITRQQQVQALEDTKKALASVRPWMVEAGYGAFKDPYEAKANLELLIQTEEQATEPNTRKVTAMKRALTQLDSIINGSGSSAVPAAPAERTGGGGTSVLDDISNITGLR